MIKLQKLVFDLKSTNITTDNGNECDRMMLENLTHECNLQKRNLQKLLSPPQKAKLRR